jgi:integrase
VPRPRKKDRHLPPCVYFKHGAYWYVKGGRWTKLGATLHEALEAYAAIHEAPQDGSMPALIDETLTYMAARQPPLAENTLKQYRGAAKVLKRKLKKFNPDQVQMRHVAAIKVSMMATPNMCNRCISVLRQVFDYALEQQKPGVTGNPAVGVKRHSEKKRDKLIEPAEYAAIYAESGDRLQIITDLLIRTGKRIGAVLRIKRVDLLEEGIRFGHHKTQTSKNIVKWTPELREVIDRAKRLYGNVLCPFLLYARRRGEKYKTTPLGPPAYRTVKDQWDRACAAAGVDDANIHDLRAVAATEAKRQGKNATQLLQHSSPQQTERYLRGKEEPIVDGPSFRRLIDSVPKKP